MQTLQGRKKPTCILIPIFPCLLWNSSFTISCAYYLCTSDTLHTGFLMCIWRHDWDADLKNKGHFFTSRTELPDQRLQMPLQLQFCCRNGCCPAWHLDSVVLAWRTRRARYKLCIDTGISWSWTGIITLSKMVLWWLDSPWCISQQEACSAWRRQDLLTVF